MKKQIIRSLRVPPMTKWLRADMHPMSKNLKSFFQDKGIKIKVTRIFPGTLIDIFEIEAGTKITSNKKLNLVIDQFSKEINEKNIQFWESIVDDQKSIKRSAIAIPKSSYKFETPEIEFNLKGKNSSIKENRGTGLDDSYYEQIAKSIEVKLEDFDLSCKIINVIKGPVVDTFELELGKKVEVKRVLALKDDISLSLRGLPIRFKEQTFGKSTLGIEVPRIPRDVIWLKDILKSKNYKISNHALPIVLGRETDGGSYILDLTEAQNLLIAGEKSSGKKVLINSVIISLIEKLDSKKLRLILIDSYQKPLSHFEKLPHLEVPYVITPKEAIRALKHLNKEMQKRVEITSYSQAEIKEANLPYIVVVINEYEKLKFSDEGNLIQKLVCNLTQKGHVVGIHIILSTSNLSPQVVDTKMLDNFLAKVVLRLRDKGYSESILGFPGTQALLGKGDMLIKKDNELHRLHSAIMVHEEIEEFVKNKIKNDKRNRTKELIPLIKELSPTQTSDFSQDEYKKAVDFVLEHRIASASFLQRKMNIGYVKAINLIDRMEIEGIVGPLENFKPRKVLITKKKIISKNQKKMKA